MPRLLASLYSRLPSGQTAQGPASCNMAIPGRYREFLQAYDAKMITEFSLMPRTALCWGLALLGGGVLGGLIFVQGLDWRARHGAEDLCRAIRPGMSIPDLRERVTARGGWLDLNNFSVLRAGTDGWHSQCRCSVGLSGQSVTSVSRVVCTH